MLMRLDQGAYDPLDAGTEHALTANVLDVFSTCDAVVVSDYGYGIVTPGVIRRLAHAMPASIASSSSIRAIISPTFGTSA